MTTDLLLHRLQSWRERWTRTAWKPITSETDGDATTSKFGGTPWLDSGESWPICPHCRTAMPLFLQLNLAQLPAAAAGIYGHGVLQLFYCTACDVHGSHLPRRVWCGWCKPAERRWHHPRRRQRFRPGRSPAGKQGTICPTRRIMPSSVWSMTTISARRYVRLSQGQQLAWRSRCMTLTILPSRSGLPLLATSLRDGRTGFKAQNIPAVRAAGARCAMCSSSTRTTICHGCLATPGLVI